MDWKNFYKSHEWAINILVNILLVALALRLFDEPVGRFIKEIIKEIREFVQLQFSLRALNLLCVLLLFILIIGISKDSLLAKIFLGHQPGEHDENVYDKIIYTSLIAYFGIILLLSIRISRK